MKRIAKSKLPKNKEASNLATENNQKSERRFIGRDMVTWNTFHFKTLNS